MRAAATTGFPDKMHEAPRTVVHQATAGRPIVHTEPYSKISVVMAEHHVNFLDLVTLCIRAKHPGRAVSRAEIVRAFIEFMKQSGIDFAQFSNADEMTEYLVAYFRRIPQSTRLPLLESALFNPTRAAQERVRRARRAIDVSPIAEE